jgi:hypothetical protein
MMVSLGISSEISLANVTIYQHGGFGGTSKILGVGRYNSGQLGIGNNQLSSLRIKKGYVALLYDGDGCTGNCMAFSAKDSDLNLDVVAIFNDKTSSIEVAQVQDEKPV